MSLDKYVRLWDKPIMTLTADSRGRLTAADLFKPGSSFDASRLPDGSIRIVELVEKEVPTVRARRIGGRLRGAAIELSDETIAAAVRAERDAR